MDINRNIAIKEVCDGDERRIFHGMHDRMVREDLPESDLDRPFSDWEMDAMLDEDYHKTMDDLCLRRKDPMHMALFMADGEPAGIVYYGISLSEDRRCFVYSFYILPEHRCRGVGRRAFTALRKLAESQGAEYFVLNTASRRASAFWSRMGFSLDGRDAEGLSLMCSPPGETGDIAVKTLTNAEDYEDERQFMRLLNSARWEQGMEPLEDVDIVRFYEAAENWESTVFSAYRQGRMVAMAVISYFYSACSGRQQPLLDMLYVEPAFRHRGIAYILVREMKKWCREKNLNELILPCFGKAEEGFHKSLGFETVEEQCYCLGKVGKE